MSKNEYRIADFLMLISVFSVCFFQIYVKERFFEFGNTVISVSLIKSYFKIEVGILISALIMELEKNFKNAFMIAALPCCYLILIQAILRKTIYSNFINWILCLTILLVACLSVALDHRYKNCKNDDILFRKVFENYLTIVLGAAFIIIFIGTYEKYTELGKQAETVLYEVSTEDWDDAWIYDYKEGERQKKLDILYKVYSIESDYLGLETKVTIQFEEIQSREDFLTEGFYLDNEKKIVINQLIEDDYEKVIDTLLHEITHVKQNEQVKKQIYDGTKYYSENVKSYEYELTNYKSSKEYGFDQYYEQLIEKEARDYAELRKGHYF